MEITDMTWRKSSYSGGSSGNCIEVGNAAGTVAVRDTKDAGNGPELTFTGPAWSTFLGAF